MNYLFIIGNGFDIMLGLDTDYQSFYNYYSAIPSPDPDILDMKRAIEKGRYETWADLEEGIGEYTGRINEPDVFLKCLEDIRKNLFKYLDEQSKRGDYQIDINKFIDDLIKPERYLEAQVLNEFDQFILQFGRSRNFYSVVTFNYTDTIDNLLPPEEFFTVSLLHLHGSLKDIPVMGVNDVSQISNILFRENEDIIEEFVKPEFNDACLNNRNEEFDQLISRANVIVLFGTSLGETDRNWWIKIGERLRGGSTIIIYYPFDEKKDIVKKPNYCRRWVRQYRDFLFVKMGVPEEERKELINRICIGINKPFLSLKKRSDKARDYIQESRK